jgi:phosphatidate phosphatase APP1
MLKGGSDQSGSGILMKVSGRVIHRETGLGIEGVTVHLDEMVTLEEFETVTNKDGLFIIKRVLQGIYELYNWFINLSCPDELVLEKYPEQIKVITGRNVIDFTLTLKTKTLETKERKEQVQLKCCELLDLFKKYSSYVNTF